jgi:hypothetical protein
MTFGLILGRFLAVVLALGTVYALGHRHQRRKAQRTTRELVISPLSGLVLGAMLSGFQAIVQPESRHRIVQEQKEENLDDPTGHEPPGGRLFAQQLKRIRQGEEVEELNVRLNS